MGMAEEDWFGFVLIAPEAISKHTTIVHDLKQRDCEIVYQEWVSLDHDRAKQFVQLYSKPEEPREEVATRAEKLTENSCMALVVKKKQISTTLKQLFGANSPVDGGGGEGEEESCIATKYQLPSELFYCCTDKNNARECIEFFFPNCKYRKQCALFLFVGIFIHPMQWIFAIWWKIILESIWSLLWYPFLLQV